MLRSGVSRAARPSCGARSWTGVVLLAVITSSAWAQLDQTPYEDPIVTLTASRVSDESRATAADLLLRTEISRPERNAIIRLLTSTGTKPEIRDALLGAFARAALVHEDYEEPLTRLVALGDVEDRPRTLLALSSLGTPSAARVLVDHATPFMPPEVAAAAFDGLIRMTGRADLGQDHENWRAWLAEHEGLDPLDWRRELVRGLTARGERLAAELGRANDSTADAFRRLFLIAPLQDRGPLLAEMVRADDPLRSLGVELVYRELAQNRPVDAQVGIASLEMLGHPSSRTRAEAARLVATLAPEQAGTRLTRALEIETEPDAAAALLSACTRWPRVASVEPALRWMDFGASTRSEAASLLLALDSEGLLTDPSHRRRVANALRAAGPRRLTADGIRLAVRTGDENDREAIAAMITSPDAANRAAAASELARRPEFADRVIAAAERDRELYAAAVAAVISHRPTPAGYAVLRAIEPPSPDARRAGLLAVARSMPPEDVLEVARTRETDPEMRVAVLSTLGTAAATPAERAALNRAKLLLAETQLELARPDAALASLAQVVPAADDTEATEAANALTVVALLWLNRVEEARDRGAGADVWLAALERIGEEPHAAEVARVTLDQFSEVLSDSERSRLRATAAVAKSDLEGPPADAVPAPPSGG
ncbi:MAG: hypothetical protein ACTS22_09590 [Phycisphaerales bacterium]